MTKTFRLDVPEQDGWVEVIDPADMSQRRFFAWVQKAAQLKENPDSGDDFLRDVIAAWHLIDPDSGQPMNDPRTDDLRGLKVSTVKTISAKVISAATAAASFEPKAAE